MAFNRFRLMVRSALYAAVGVALVLVAVPDAAVGAIPDDNGQIAYWRSGELWLMDADGASPRPLVTTVVVDCCPAFSSDGTKIAFTGFDPDEPAPKGVVPDIWVIGADGSGLRNVTSLPGPDFALGPSWSPDGKQLVYATTDWDLWIVDVDTGARKQITFDRAHQNLPSWSPDGSLIAHCSMPVAGNLISGDENIWVMEPDGNNSRQLTTDGNSCSPAWSPDSSRIAYVTYDFSGPAPDDHADVWIMNADGSAKRNLTNNPKRFDRNPTWSPDGAKIAFDSAGPLRVREDPVLGEVFERDPPSDIFVVASGGGTATKLTTGDQGDADPTWQPLPGIHRVGLVDPNQGMWYLREQGTVRSFFYGNPVDVPFLGDWDCDGEDTPGLYRQSDGFVYLRNSDTQGIADVRYFFGDPGDIPIAGDFDGDGCDTVSLYRPSEGRVYIHNKLGSGDAGLGAAEIAYYFGNPGDKPFTGDFDGDGIKTIGLHRESTGLVYFRNSHTAGIADVSFIYGDPGDRFVAGDWNQDGIDTAGLFRPANAKFYFRTTNTQGIADGTLVWGDTDWLPVAGSFDLN